MKKPQGYDEAQAFGEFETLPAGGYKCIIKKIVCETSQNGKEYLKLAVDNIKTSLKRNLMQIIEKKRNGQEHG